MLLLLLCEFPRARTARLRTLSVRPSVRLRSLRAWLEVPRLFLYLHPLVIVIAEAAALCDRRRPQKQETRSS